MAAGRVGRCTRLPAQLGHTPFRTESAQWAQNVHSNVQMRASADSGGRSRSQHSQFGFSNSMVVLLRSGSMRGASRLLFWAIIARDLRAKIRSVISVVRHPAFRADMVAADASDGKDCMEAIA